MSLHQDPPEFPLEAETRDCAQCVREFIPTGDETVCKRRDCMGSRGTSKRRDGGVSSESARIGKIGRGSK